MKKGFAVLAVVLLLLSAQVTQAVTLEEGWYVKLGGVAFFGTDPGSGYGYARGWAATSALGTYGPFTVIHPTEYDPVFPQRVISVTTTVTGVSAGTAVYVYGELDGPLLSPATRIDVVYETNYDPSKMLLKMYQRHAEGWDELIWTPRHTYGLADVLDGTGRTIPVGDSIYFQIVAVPEPPQPVLIILGCSALAALVRRQAR